MAAVKNRHKRSDLNNTDLLSYSSGDWKSELGLPNVKSRY